MWFIRYPCPRYVIYDNGSEFKAQFHALVAEYGLVHKPTTVNNPTENAILERAHQVIGGMLCTSQLDMDDSITNEDVQDFIENTSWAI